METLEKFLGTKFVGFLLAGLAVYLGCYFIEDADKLRTFVDAVQNIFITYCGGNVLATAAGAIKDAVIGSKIASNAVARQTDNAE